MSSVTVPAVAFVTSTLVAGVSGVTPAIDDTYTLSTTSMILHAIWPIGPRHTTRNAVPSTAAVAPPAFTSNEPVCRDLCGAAPRLADRERALGLATAALVRQLGDRELRRDSKAGEGAVGVVDLGARR